MGREEDETHNEGDLLETRDITADNLISRISANSTRRKGPF